MKKLLLYKQHYFNTIMFNLQTNTWKRVKYIAREEFSLKTTTQLECSLFRYKQSTSYQFIIPIERHHIYRTSEWNSMNQLPCQHTVRLSKVLSDQVINQSAYITAFPLKNN